MKGFCGAGASIEAIGTRYHRHAADGSGHVPGVAVLTSFLLVLVSIAVLVIYVQHIGQSLRVSALIELVGKDTRSLIDEIYPAGQESPRDAVGE